MELENLSYGKIRRAYEEKGYAFFDKGNFNINIGGIRSLNSQSDSFDDVIFVAYVVNRVPQLRLYKATTDPGKHWLLNPLNKNGTAIMVPGQYRGAYVIGIHGRSGKYPYKALEQVKPMSYVRDNNKDNKLDFRLYRDPKLAQTHVFEDVIKSNIHRASKWKILQAVGRYSAGCQVMQSATLFDEFIKLCEISARNYGNSFTYTLFEEDDIL